MNLPFHPPSFFPSADCPPFIYLIQKPTYGAPTLHPFSKKLVPSPANPYCTGAPISVSKHSSQIILYSFGNCTKICFQHLHSFFSSPSATFFLRKVTHVTLAWSIHYLLLPLTSPINPEYLTIHVPLLSEFVHFFTPLAQFNPRLVVTLMLGPVLRLLPHTLYPQTRAISSLTTS